MTVRLTDEDRLKRVCARLMGVVRMHESQGHGSSCGSALETPEAFLRGIELPDEDTVCLDPKLIDEELRIRAAEGTAPRPTFVTREEALRMAACSPFAGPAADDLKRLALAYVGLLEGRAASVSATGGADVEYAREWLKEAYSDGYDPNAALDRIGELLAAYDALAVELRESRAEKGGAS